MADENINEEQTNDVPDSLDNLSDDDLLNMSDEELANLGTEDEPEETETTSEEEAEEESDSDSDSQEESEEEDSGTDEETEDESVDEDTDSEDDSEESSEDADEDKEEKPTSPLTEEVQTKLDSYDALFQPLKANGVDIAVDNVEDARRLMQMGLGFSKRMAEIKPIRKVGKMLQDNDLMDEGKLNHLIDISKGNPEAIAKLLKDNDIDPLSLDTDKTSEYKPNTYNATDEQITLSDVLQPLAGTESGQAIIDTVSNKWDSRSQEMITKTPEIFNVLDEHKRNGAFDKITAKVTLDRALGKHAGLSDIEAYHAVGEQLFGQGDTSKQEAQPEEKKPAEKQETPKPKAKKSSAEDKKALASRNQASAEKSELDIESLAALSDEEFEKRYAEMNF